MFSMQNAQNTGKTNPILTVMVLLALLLPGVKGNRPCSTLPAFLSPTVAQVLVEIFDINPSGSVDEYIAAMMKGK